MCFIEFSNACYLVIQPYFQPKGKGRSQVLPRTGREGPEGEVCSSTLPSTSALDGMGGQHHAPTASLPGKSRYPLYRRLGGPQDRSGRVRKMSPSTGIRSPDRPARSESLYRLRYPGPHCQRNLPFVNNGLLVNLVSSPSIYVYAQIRPSGESLTNYVALLWIEVGQPLLKFSSQE